MKSTYLIFITALTYFLATPTLYAFSIGAKQHVPGPAIHSTYFMTVNNNQAKVQAKAYLGLYINGICQHNAVYDIGNEEITTGDTIYIDAFALKLLIGNQFSCMTIYYNNQQVAQESFQLISDGINYIATFPSTAQVNIS